MRINKRIMAAAVLILTATTAKWTHADTVKSLKAKLPDHFIEIKIGEESKESELLDRSKNYEVKYLRKRVETLERAVRQLQEEIYRIKYTSEIPNTPKLEVKKTWACMVESSFSKTYLGKGDTKIEASAEAMKSCQQVDGISCKEKNLKCSSE